MGRAVGALNVIRECHISCYRLPYSSPIVKGQRPVRSLRANGAFDR